MAPESTTGAIRVVTINMRSSVIVAKDGYEFIAERKVDGVLAKEA